jgi:hypothetical protein
MRRRPSKVRELPRGSTRAVTRRVTRAILGATQPGKALLPIDELIPYLLRKAGGRMAASQLQFELRWRGILPELAAPALKDLGERAVIRRPLLAGEAAYELTAHGWVEVIRSSKGMTRPRRATLGNACDGERQEPIPQRLGLSARAPGPMSSE